MESLEKHHDRRYQTRTERLGACAPVARKIDLAQLDTLAFIDANWSCIWGATVFRVKLQLQQCHFCLFSRVWPN